MNIIFDNKILAQYILTGADVKVVVDGDILTLADTTDVQNPRIGYGSDIHGEMYQYNYADIDYIIVNGHSIDAETFEKAAEAEMGKGNDAADTKEKPEEDSNKDAGEDGEDQETNESSNEQIALKAESFKVAGRPVKLNKGKKEDGTDWTVTFKNGETVPLSDVLALIKPFPKGIKERTEESVIKPGDYVIVSHPASKNFGSGGNVLISERNHITYEYYDDRQKKMSYDTVPTGWVIKNMED